VTVAAAVAAAAAAAGSNGVPARPTLHDIQVLIEAAAVDPLSSGLHGPLAALMTAIETWKESAQRCGLCVSTESR
jgi:hypothetical protein